MFSCKCISKTVLTSTNHQVLFVFRRLSDKGTLSENADNSFEVSESQLGTLAVEAYERRIQRLETEKRELQRKLMGNIMTQMLN